MSQLDFCPACGTRFDKGAAVCRNCGASRPDAEATAVEDGHALEASAAALEALTAELAEALTPKLQLLRPLGQGGMGTVFLARDPALKRLVVVKVLSPDLAHDDLACRRFEREAESAAAVAHPNVVGVFQVGRLPRSGCSYFVMQYVEGQTLADAFPLGTVVPVPRARRIVGEVAAALAAAHARGLVHRDIKPANIMLERDSDRVVVLDFGISAAISPERLAGAGTKLTQVGASIGTPQYMSPEQAAGEEVTDRSDVYSLGIVAYELLAGRAVFKETTPMALAAAHINKVPPPVATVRPDVDAPFAQLVDQCLAKAPKDRPTAEQVVRALGAASGPVIEWPPPGLDALRGLGTRLSRALTVAVGAALIFYALLFQPPTLAGPAWASGEQSGLWFTVGGGCCENKYAPAPRWDPTPTWASLLVLLVIVEAALAAFALAQAVRLQTGVARARRSGYPLQVCLDVAFDGHRDTAALINGAGAFASLAEPARANVRHWRRWRAAIGAAAPILAAILGVAWLVLEGGGAHAGRVVSAPAFTLLLLPFVGALLGYLILSAREGSAVPRAHLTWRQWLARQRQPLVIRDVATSWLQGAPGAGAANGKRFRWLLTAGHAGVALVLVALVAVMALVTYVGVSSSMTVAKYRPAAETWQDLRRPWWFSVSWNGLDSALRSLGVMPAATVPDSEAAAAVARLLFAAARPGADPEVGLAHSVAAQLLSAPVRASTVSLPGYSDYNDYPSEARFLAVMRGRATSISAHLRREVDSNLASTGYQAWERFGRAAPPPTLWYYVPDFGGLSSGAFLHHPEYARYKNDFGPSALMGILLAVQRSDRARASAVAGELLAAGLTLARQPVDGPSREGSRLVHWGLIATREVARKWGDRVLETRADSVLDAITRSNQRSMFSYGSHQPDWRVEAGAFAMGPIMLVSDATSRYTRDALEGKDPGNEGMGDARLPRPDRWRLIAAVLPAYCTSPREVLMGIDPARATALEAALGKQPDLPRTDEWIRANLRWYQVLRDDPGSALKDSPEPVAAPWFLKPLGWIGLGRMRDRIVFCDEHVWD